jgi:uncharacterized protein YjlB
MLPIYRSTASTIDVPWDKIHQDIDSKQEMWHEASAGYSTMTMDLRRDCEPWAKGFRQKVMEIVKLTMPFVGDATYEDLTKISWVNKVLENEYVKYHTHYPCDIAVVWYLNAAEGCGNFVLEYDGGKHPIEIKTDDVIAFPASLGHYTLPNDNSERWVMATNMVWTANMMNKLSHDAWSKLYENRQQKITEKLIEWHEKNFTPIPV